MRTNHGKKGNEQTTGDQNEAEEEGKRGRLGESVEFGFLLLHLRTTLQSR